LISKDNKIYNIKDVKILKNKQYSKNKPKDYLEFIVDAKSITLSLVKIKKTVPKISVSQLASGNLQKSL